MTRGARQSRIADGWHPTEYVWQSVWERDAWLEIIEKFVFVDSRARWPSVRARRRRSSSPAFISGTSSGAAPSTPASRNGPQLPHPTLRGVGQDQGDRLAGA